MDVRMIPHAFITTLFCQIPDIPPEYGLEKLGFAAILFFVIWSYISRVLPKTQERIDRQDDRLDRLAEAVEKLSESIRKQANEKTNEEES